MIYFILAGICITIAFVFVGVLANSYDMVSQALAFVIVLGSIVAGSVFLEMSKDR